MLHVVAKGLDYLLPEVVFVGGSVTELYATDAASTEIRSTNDVDCVIELFSRTQYYKLEEQLRKLQFSNDIESGIICRWNFRGLKVDIMPNDETIIGFSNPWYAEGMKHTLNYTFPDGLQIRYFKTAYFLASKFVAFNDRGKSNVRLSSDFEDIVYILDNRKDLTNELMESDGKVVDYLKSECIRLLENKILEEGVFCMLPLNSDHERINHVISIIREISLL